MLACWVACLTLGAFEGFETGAWAVLFTPVWIVLAKLFGLYDRDHRMLRHLTIDELPVLALWTLACTVATALLLAVSPPGKIPFTIVVLIWGVGFGGASLLRGIMRYLWRRIAPPERTLIFGDGPLAAVTRRKIELFPDTHLAIVSQRGAAELNGADTLHGVDRVIVALSSVDERMLAELVSRCRQQEIKLSVVPPVHGMFGTAVTLNHIADLPVVEYNTWDVSRSTMLLKRLLDLAISVPLLLLSVPLIALIAVAISLDSAGPVFFVQQRAGVHGRPFRIVKFRTMVPDAQERLSELVSVDELATPMFKLARDPRVTRLGRVLRRTSLDELPQLLNVVRGDMSLVGPRPEQTELVDRYVPEHVFRLTVKPGLTGPMQVYGRGQLSFDERLAVEREYIENLSMGRDLRILLLTLTAVVGGRGAY